MQIWLTGGSGCGKSTAADVFRKNGYKILDADKIAREITQKGGAAYAEIVAAFGNVLCADGEIDRRTLARLIFSDAEKLSVLNQITHKYIIKTINEGKKNEKNVLIDAPLPNTFGVVCDKTVVISAPIADRIRRIMARDGITEGEAAARIDAQADRSEYEKNADAIIENSTDAISFIEKIDVLAKEWYTV